MSKKPEHEDIEIPFYPALPKDQTHVWRDKANLNNADFAKALIGIMLAKQGLNELEFSQADFNYISGLGLLEGFSKTGNFMVVLAKIDHEAGKVTPLNNLLKKSI